MRFLETAESHGGAAESHDAVITVPIHFNEQQRRIIRYNILNSYCNSLCLYVFFFYLIFSSMNTQDGF